MTVSGQSPSIKPSSHVNSYIGSAHDEVELELLKAVAWCTSERP